MDNNLQLLIEMRDKLSKPLTDQQKALKSVQTQIKELIKAQKDEEKASVKQAKQLAQAKKAAQEWSKAVGAEMVAAAEAGAAFVAAAAAAVLALGGALVYATAKTAEFVAAQAAMGEKLAVSYLFGTKDQGAAERTRGMIDDLAARLKVGPEKLHDTAKELLTSGIKPQRELQRSVQAITELQKTGNDDAANKLKGLLKRGAESRRAFGGQGMIGISKGEAIEALGAGGWEDLQKAIQARGGKALRTGYNSLMTNADTLNAALADVISGGRIGKAARGMIGDLEAVATRARQEIRRFFQDIAKGEGFRAFVAQLHQAINVFEALTKAGGNKGPLNLLDVGFKLLSKAISLAITLTLRMWIGILKLAVAATGAMLAFKKWIAQGDRLNILKAALAGVGIALAGILAVVALLALAFAALWVVILLPLILVIAAFAGLGIAIYEFAKTVRKYLNKDAMKALAADAIQGLIDALLAGPKMVERAGAAIGAALKNGVKGALDIHSPSREMAKLGQMSAQGFQQGLDGHSFQIGAIQTPNLGGVGARSIGDVNIEVNLQGSTNMTADELKPLLMTAFADAWEQLRLEMGNG